MHARWCVCAPFLMRDPQHRGAEGISWPQKWSVLKSKKISSLWKSAAFLPFFPSPPFSQEHGVNAWITESITSHSPAFPSCFPLLFLACCCSKAQAPLFFFLCEHMINSWEHLTLSLHFFLTLVVSFSGEIDDTTQLSPVGVSLWGLLLRICTVTHVYKHADFFFLDQISVTRAHGSLTSLLRNGVFVIDKFEAWNNAGLQLKKWERRVIHFFPIFPHSLFFFGPLCALTRFSVT